MLKNTPAGYKKEYPWLKEVDSLALANVQLNLAVQKHTDTMLPTKGKYSFFSYGTQVTMDLSTLMINIQFSHLIQKINGFSHFTQS